MVVFLKRSFGITTPVDLTQRLLRNDDPQTTRRTDTILIRGSPRYYVDDQPIQKIAPTIPKSKPLPATSTLEDLDSYYVIKKLEPPTPTNPLVDKDQTVALALETMH